MKKITKKGLTLMKVLMMTVLLVGCTTPLAAVKADTALLIIDKAGTLTGSGFFLLYKSYLNQLG